MEASLGQVRALALRTATNNVNLVAALETLADAATANAHPDAEHYKMVLKACREHEAMGPLNTLVTRLLGTEVAKKVATGLETWKKSVAKASNATNPQSGHQGTQASNMPYYPGFMPGPPPMWSGFPPSYGSFRGRGRGRGRGSRSIKQCFVCRSPEHFASDCPKNK